MARKRRDIHRPHRKHEPQPFTRLTVWHALWALTGDGECPVTALQVAMWIRRDIPHSVTGPRVSHNDVSTVRVWCRQLVTEHAAEECAERPASPVGGRRPQQFRALHPPNGARPAEPSPTT